MKKRFKKFMALVMAATLLCSSITAFAADPVTTKDSPASGNASGTGNMEGWVDKDVFCVKLPTSAINSDQFNFILDPQDLIRVSGNGYEAYTITGDDGLYFPVSADAFSSSSTVLTAYNKGTCPVDVAISATVSNLASGDTYSIGLAASKDALEDSEGTDIYLAINVSGDGKDADGTAVTGETALVKSGATGTATVDGIILDKTDNAWEVKASGNAASHTYSYELKGDMEDDDFQKISFNLVGACAKESNGANWDAVNKATDKPSIEITWELKRHENDKAPSAPATATVVAGEVGYIPVSMGIGTLAATSATVKLGTSPNGTFSSNVNYTFDATTQKIKIGAPSTSSNKGKTVYVKIEFNTGDSSIIAVTVQ